MFYNRTHFGFQRSLVTLVRELPAKDRREVHGQSLQHELAA